MTLNIFDILNSGHAALEYLLHFSGIPWYVTTSQHLIDNLTSAQRRLIFNDQYYTDGGSKYLADYMQGYPLLQIPEEQKFRVEPGFGTLTGGDWYAEIADRHVVNNWHGRKRDIYGLEGLTAIADPRQDETIGCATLHQPFRADDTSIVVFDDIGGRLNDRISNAWPPGPEPYYLWIEGECIGSDGIDSLVDGVLTISIPNTGAQGSCWRGLLRSKNCGHFTHTANSSRIRVTDAPLNGVLGRPYCLWVFAKLRDGTYTNPFLLRHGKTGLDINYQKRKGGNVWRVQCLPYRSWLDRDIELAKFESHIQRYVFSRGSPSTLRQEPPLKILEKVGAAWTEIEVWLCGAGNATSFETLEDLYDAVASACTTASAASGNSYNYNCGPGGPYPTSTPSDHPRMTGPLPAILRWGDIDACPDIDEDWQQGIANYHVANKPESEFWWGDTDDSVTLSTMKMLSISNQISERRTNPPYIVQWYQHTGTCEDTVDETVDLPAHMKKFPLSPIGPANQYRLYLDPAIDASDVEVGDTIQIGDKLTAINLHQSCPNPTASEAVVDAVGSFGADPDSSYFDIDVVGGGFSPDASSVPYFKGVATDVDPEPSSKKKFSQGMFLFWVPELAEKDPWKVGLEYVIGPAEKLSWILRAIVGDNMSVYDIYCPEHIQADFIPDLAPGVASDLYDNQECTIDWDSLDMLAATGTIPGATFRVDLAGKLNLWQYIVEELKFYGAVPTMEPDPEKMQMVMRFRRAGLVNGTMAYLGGRKLTAAHIAKDSAELEATAEQAASWVLNTVDLKFAFDPLKDEYLYTWPFVDASGFAAVGGRTNKITVEARITQVPPTATAKIACATHFISILNRFTRGMPIFRCDAGIQTLLTHGLGVDVLCTYDAVHNPNTGAMGIVEQAGAIIEWSHDPRKSKLSFGVQVADYNKYGIAPTVTVPANETTKIDNQTVDIMDIEDGAQKYCGQTDTTAGWYEHWWFDCLIFNQTMDAPAAAGCSCGDYGVEIWELDSETPTIYAIGLTCTFVDPRDYATIDAAGTKFMRIEGPVGWALLFDTSKRYGIRYCGFDKSNNQPCQKRWLYQADTVLQLEDSGAVEYPGRRWD